MFNALVIENGEQGYRTNLKALNESQQPDHGVTLDVSWSTLNYKDALAICNKGPIVRQFPMVPGIDFVGRVTASRHPDWKLDDVALLTGWGIGEKQWGGLAQKASVPGDWLVEVPATLSPQQTMAIGSAGLTAMLCVMALEKQGVTPEMGPVLVTGASGGVGSFSVSLLSRLGFEVDRRQRSRQRRGVSDRHARRALGYRPQRTVAARQVAGERALGGGDRQRRQPYAEQHAGRLRYGAGAGAARQRRALYPARRDANRRRQRDVSETAAPAGLATARRAAERRNAHPPYHCRAAQRGKTGRTGSAGRQGTAT